MKKLPEDLAAKLYCVGDQFLAEGSEGRMMERMATLAQKAKATERSWLR